MSLQIADNYQLLAKKPLDSRQQFKTIADMKAFPETRIWEGATAFNFEDYRTYIYKSTFTDDATYGKWRTFGEGDSFLKIESFTADPAYAEVGTTVNVKLDWVYSEVVEKQTLDSVELADDVRTHTYQNISADTDFKLAAENIDNESVGSTISIKFVNPIYVGSVAETKITAGLTDTDITGLTKIVKPDNKFIWENVNITDEVPVIAIPKAFGKPEEILDQNGLEYLLDSFKEQEMQVNSVDYYVYTLNGAVYLVNHTFIVE